MKGLDGVTLSLILTALIAVPGAIFILAKVLERKYGQASIGKPRILVEAETIKRK